MAKSSRASTTKANNQLLKAKVFGPVESARQERLSAKLLELASQPKPVPEKEMKDAEEERETEDKTEQEPKADDCEFALPDTLLWRRGFQGGPILEFLVALSRRQFANYSNSSSQPWT